MWLSLNYVPSTVSLSRVPSLGLYSFLLFSPIRNFLDLDIIYSSVSLLSISRLSGGSSFRFSASPYIKIKAPVSSILLLRDSTTSKRVFLFCSTVPVKAESHHLSLSGTSRQPPVNNSVSFFMLPPKGADAIALTFAQCGGGFAFEYSVRLDPESNGGVDKPFTAITNAGGTVMRPILKQHSETATVWTMAPSGSAADASLAAAALRAMEESWEEETKGVSTDGASAWSGRGVSWTFWTPWSGPVLLGVLNLDVSNLLLWGLLTNLWTMNIYLDRCEHSIKSRCCEPAHFRSQEATDDLTSYCAIMGICWR